MLLSFIDVGLSFHGSKAESRALERVSFDVSAGEFVSIVGPSGCGKTSILRLISRTLTPTEGTLDIHESVGGIGRSGVVFQDPVLLPWRTALENVMLPLEVLGGNPGENLDIGRRAIERTGLSDFSDHLPQQLSGGMRQRVAIARALVTDPEILLMDEPFSALDSITRERMNEELQTIWSESKKTIVFVTHSIPEAVFLSDRVVVLTERPASVQDTILVDLPRPRDDASRESPGFNRYCGEIRRLLKNEPSDAA